jgi:tetratricopeptide (TPR) repeat protein
MTMASNDDNGGTPSASSAFATVLQPGQKFGTRYTIIRLIGDGGMGAVYHAWDESLGIAVALKVIKIDATTHPADVRQLEARFKRELLLARQVTHPNVVRIHDLGEVGDTKYLTMAYVQGDDLASLLRREGRLPVSRALSIARQIVSGLAAAHDAGVVHRDLKPANVMLDGEGHALLTDFGIARATDAATLHTVPGSIVGTLDYMAPEQARGEAADRRSDIYAFGLILYELLAGGRPRAAGGGLTDLLARIEQGPPALRSVAPDIPSDLERIVAQSVAQDPASRYQSAADLLHDLNALGTDGVAAPTVVAQPRRHAMVAAAVALLVAVTAGVAWWFGRQQAVPVPAVTQEPVSVLIADFDNRAGDPVFEETLEQALGLAMEGAAFITSHSRVEAARLAGELRKGSGLDPAAAELVAVREGIGVVLAGAIEPAGGGYQLEVRVLRPGGSEPLAIARASASDKGDVLRAVDRLAEEIRTALGDTAPSSHLQGETFSAGSLEAVRAYTIAQNLTTDRKNEEALEYYRQAVAHDGGFGRAHAGWAVALFDLGRRVEAEEKWKTALSLMDRMTEREKYRTLGAYFIGIARNYDQAIESYTSLVVRYPADLAGHNNLALAYFYTLDFPKALEHGRRAIAIYPASLKFQNNYALYAMYAGDFETAADSARKVIERDPRFEAAYLPLAMASLSQGDTAAARAVYGKAKEAGAAGASLAAIGLADIALLEGSLLDAVTILQAATPIDAQRRNTYGEATKSVALAEALSARGDTAAAVRAADRALADFRDEFVAVPAARVFAAAKQPERVAQLIRGLEENPQPQPRAYARIIAGERALHAGRFSEAIQELTAAKGTADVWLARFGLGVAYVQAGQYAEAISELEACEKRRGEATAVFLDDIPTYRYLAALPYWLGRAREGVDMPSAADSYEQFLRIRSAAKADPLVADARARVAALRQPVTAR